MKPLHIFIFLFSLTVLSCVKTNNEDIDPNATNIADYSTLIIGTWQLKDIGTK